MAGPGLAEHLEIEVRPLQQTLGLEQPAGVLQGRHPPLELELDVLDRLVHLLARRHEVPGRIDIDAVTFGQHLAGQRVELGDALDLVAEELHPDREVVVRRVDLERVAADAELPPDEALVVALVLDVDEMPQHVVAPHPLAFHQPHRDGAVVDGRAKAVDAGDRGDDDHVTTLEEGAGRGMAELVDLLVARRVLLDVRVAPGDVGLGLVVVVVGDEVLDGVVREELLELAIQLRGERLVVGEDERGSAAVGDDLGHGDRLP